jgi:hypothetical protein
MALVSPGIEVKVVDESQYASTAVGTVPMLVIATATNKNDPTSTGVASGTAQVNAEKTYLIGSQRELVTTFGEPSFYKSTSGTALHGYEQNEYGLMAAYSLLGASNRAYVVRADVDLSELTGQSGRPTAKPVNGTHWLDTAKSKFGIFEWNATTQTFTNKVPTVITDSTKISSNVPLASIGKAGDYAIDASTNNNTVSVRTASGWKALGTTNWHTAIPTVQGTASGGTVSSGDSITINGTTVTTTSTTYAQTVADINAASITGVTAALVNSKIEIYGQSTAASNQIVIANVSGTLLTDIGVTAATYNVISVLQQPHTSIPEWKTADATSAPTGSVWIKTTTPNNGAKFDVSAYSTTLAKFVAKAVNVYRGDRHALYGLDSVGGGLNIDAGTVYAHAFTNSSGFTLYKLYERKVKGSTVVTGTANAPTFVVGDAFTITSSAKGVNTVTGYTVTATGTTAADIVNDINTVNIPYVTASLASTGAITLTHTLGGVMILANTNNTPLATAGFTTANAYLREGATAGNLVASNFQQLVYTAGSIEPSTNPATGRLWFHNVTDEMDIMIHDGTNWKGYHNVSTDARGFDLSTTSPNGPLVSATEPTEQSDKSALVYGDLWVDTSDLENFPIIKRWEQVSGTDKFVTIDNTDQTSEDGILFADARYMGNATTDVVSGDITTTKTLLTSDYTDLDVPLAANYPRGMLMFNMRRSSYNVKEFKKDFFNSTNFPGKTLPTEKDAWVSKAGLQNDGSPFMGRQAVRQVVVAAMKSAIDTSSELREEQRNFNVMAAPGYPELIANMVSLNNDRRNTAFVIGDTPMRLAANSTDIQNWATNAKLATDNNDDGMVTADTYLGVFYPSGITTDLSGNSIVVPSSHMMLRTMIRSDDASYPWFAPAGTRRGIVDNATGLGYIDVATGEFTSVGVRESLRDTLYENSINPITFLPGNGVLNYGNKTKTATASALDRINVSRLTAYIRERLAVITKPFVFEPNDKLTRDEVKQVVEQLMNDLVAKRGLYDYLVVCDETNNTNDRIDRNELYIDIAIEPVKAVEYIYIPVRIQNTGSI